MIVVYHVKLNVSQPNVIKGILAKQRDINSRVMDCAFYHEKRRLTVPTECTAVVNAMRADGEYRSFAGSVNPGMGRAAREGLIYPRGSERYPWKSIS